MKRLSNNGNRNNCRIAVIGAGCYYPGAKSTLQLWENVLARRQQFREMPDIRLPKSEYYDPDPMVPDKTYQSKAAVMDGFQFDWLDKKIPKGTFDSTDIVHWLALDTVLKALNDAGYQKDNVPKDNTGVIIGNTLTGEFTRSNNMLLRWPYVKKVLLASLKQKGLSHHFDSLESIMEKYYKSVFTPVNEDTLAGGLANTIAGRVCNFLDLHGGGYIVDGACSSSLLAIITGANYLESGQMDMVIAGGVDISLDTFELVGFSKTKALAPDEMQVYDKGGRGFIPGEGCGTVILKRLEDARRDNDQVYSVITGWGISSDGKGGITAPNAKGQSRALIRAHKKAGIDTGKIDFIEGHGTGTTVGDKIELEGMAIALNIDKELPNRSCGITSYKSIVGHTKAAAGVGAFIKTVIALNRRILPPTAGLRDFNPVFEDTAKTIYPIIQGQVRDPKSVLTAGVSAMGFGGINSHVVMQSGDKPHDKFKPHIEERKLLVSEQSSELFMFSGRSVDDLILKISDANEKCAGISYAEMTDMAFHINTGIDQQAKWRAAVVASKPLELGQKLKDLISAVKKDPSESLITIANDTVVFGEVIKKPRIGVLFPGQGAQRLNMGRGLIERFDWAEELALYANNLFIEEGDDDVLSKIYRPVDRIEGSNEENLWKEELKQTNIAQPAITLVSLIWFRYLEKLGIKIDAVSGHSLGELMSFYATGRMNDEQLLRFAAFRGKKMGSCGSGTMASLVCTKEKAEKLIIGIPGYLTIANINALEQTVVSGEADSIHKVIKKAEALHIGAVELPVSAAFHSDLISDAAIEVRNFKVLEKSSAKANSIKLISSVSGDIITPGAGLNNYFSDQTIRQVNFINTVDRLIKECDILIEIGPGRVLSGLVSGITGDIKCFPVEAEANDDISLNRTIANLYIRGADINVQELYSNRLIRDFQPASEKDFIVNPLERPLPGEVEDKSDAKISGVMPDSLFHDLDKDSTLFRDYYKVRKDFIRDVLEADMKHFHLYSTKDEVSPAGVEESVPDRSYRIHDKDKKDNKKISVRKMLNEALELATGFPAASYSDNMKLLDDFNLDSIKAGALIAGLSKALSIQGKISAGTLANASIGKIVETIEEHMPAGDSVNNMPAKPSGNENVEDIVLKMVADKTGFPLKDLRLDFRILDDLNLDSIKASALIAELSRKFNIQGKLQAVNYANARLEELITGIKSQSGLTEKTNLENTSEDLGMTDNWVRDFTAVIEEEPLIVDNEQRNAYWRDKSVMIVYAKKNVWIEEFSRELEKMAIHVKITGFRDIVYDEKDNPDVVFIVLPDEEATEGSVKETVELLSAAAKYTVNKDVETGFLQFGDGYFAHGEGDTGIKNHFGAIAFAASIHLERPRAKIRAVELDNNMTVQQASVSVLDEFLLSDRFVSSGYNSEGVRSVRLYEIAKMHAGGSGSYTLDSKDVVLVTGGAKGITAACAFAAARKYRCTMVLTGSSAISDEIRLTMQKYEEEGLTALYYTCDITDPGSVKKMVSLAGKETGRITAVIHGAGRNIPRRAEQVSAGEAFEEISPKMTGAINIVNALSEGRLKAFIALTSVIGVTGMPGNSWYAFSNEVLDLFLRNVKKRSHVKTKSLAYSVWSSIGMGARMGSAETLGNMGIGAVSPEEGTDHFLRCFEHEADDQQVIIASRLGGLDTWKRKRQSLPDNFRFLETVSYHEPGVELKIRTKLNRETDLYSEDHNYNGSLLLPTVFGLEAMAEAVAAVLGREKLDAIKFENINLLKPIVIPDEGSVEVQVRALVHEPEGEDGLIKVSAGISTEDSDFTDEHFSSDFIVGIWEQTEHSDVTLPEKPLPIIPGNDLYNWLLFQGKRFQYIDRVYSLNSGEAVYRTKRVQNDTSGSCFPEKKSWSFILGSPLFRDALLQSVQLILTQNKYLPVRIKEWEIPAVNRQVEGDLVVCEMVNQDLDSGVCDVRLISESGEILEHIRGYEVKALEPSPEHPMPEEMADFSRYYGKKILNAFQQHSSMIRHEPILIISKNDRFFNVMNNKERHAAEQELFKHEFVNKHEKPDNLKISWQQNGKPVIENSELGISISHSRSVLIMSVGKEEQGCDIEFVESRSKDDWCDLLENKHLELFDRLETEDKDINISGTRIWSIRETVIKAFGQLPLSITIAKILDKHILFTVRTPDHIVNILTFPVRVLPGNSYVVAVITGLPDDENPDDNSRIATVSDNLFNERTGAFSTEFITTFKECKGFYGKTYFTDFPLWMGSLRELVLSPVSKQLLADLGSGKYGMVTNHSDINVYNEAESLNRISGSMRITGNSDLENSFIDLSFEWFRQSDTGNLIRLADCNLSTTWVSIEGRGIVKKSPLPGYFRDFLSEYMREGMINSLKNGIDKYINMSELGKTIYSAPAFPRPEILLNRVIHETGMYDSNAVGNLYYSNYYDWQAKSIERLIHATIPEIFLSGGKKGEYVCLQCGVNHIQEAMPFEDIEVCMYLETLFENGIRFYFEYFSSDKENKRKLAYGNNTIIWAKRLHDHSLPYVKSLPEKLLAQVMDKKAELI